MSRSRLPALLVATSLAALPFGARAQQSLTPLAASGRTVSPAFEGWYVNPDGSYNTPPSIKFDAAGPAGRGPLGITAGPLKASVGVPLTIPVWVTDDGKFAPSNSATERQGSPVALAWFKHQGPGDVTFSPATARLTPTGGTSSSKATFAKPGDYLLRVRANDSPVAGAGHA